MPPLSDAVIDAQLCSFIAEQLVYDQPDFQVTPTLNLITQRIIDSLGMLRLRHFLEAQFAITLAPDDLVMQHFETVTALRALIQHKLEATARA